MKRAMIALDKEIRRYGLDARKVADIHDEWQFVVAQKDVQRFIELALGVFPPTGANRLTIESLLKVTQR
jgi:DNA polymerase I-like protein with 3'-5' exonuclease and polymerase domains